MAGGTRLWYGRGMACTEETGCTANGWNGDSMLGGRSTGSGGVTLSDLSWCADIIPEYGRDSGEVSLSQPRGVTTSQCGDVTLSQLLVGTSLAEQTLVAADGMPRRRLDGFCNRQFDWSITSNRKLASILYK